MLTSFVNKVKEAVWTVKSGGSNWHLEIDLLSFVSQTTHLQVKRLKGGVRPSGTSFFSFFTSIAARFPVTFLINKSFFEPSRRRGGTPLRPLFLVFLNFFNLFLISSSKNVSLMFLIFF